MKLGLTPSRAKVVMKLATPVMFAMLTQTALNLVDTAMVGRLPRAESIPGQASLGYSLILLWMLGGFLSSIQVGTQAITARRFGEEKYHRSGQALSNSLLLALFSGTIVSLLAAYYMDWIFPLFDENPMVVACGTEYARYRMLGILSMVATASYKAFFDGIGKTHVHLAAAVVMNAINFPLNYVLIFGWGPFPEMGVAGAGLGSLISTYVGLAVMVGWSGLPRYRIKYRYYRWRNFSKKIAWDITRVSVPGGLATVFVMTGFALFFKLIGILDTENGILASVYGGFTALSEHAFVPHFAFPLIDNPGRTPSEIEAVQSAFDRGFPILNSAANCIKDIMSVCFMLMLALGTATATLVGQSLGAKKPDEAAAYGWESVRIGLTMASVFAVVTFFFPGTVISWLNPDLAVIAAGRTSVQIMGVSSLSIAVGMVLAQALFGAGLTRYVMWVEGGLHLVCLIPATYLMGFVLDLGLAGVWCAASLYVTLLAVAMGGKFWRGGWQDVEL